MRGEDEFRNKGVTYCATCDGPLFSDMDVAVIGGGNAALEAVLQLVKIAKKIYLIDAEPQLRADQVMVEKVKNDAKVIIYDETKIEEISGNEFLERIKISRQNKIEELAVKGVFIEIGSMAASEIINITEKNEVGEIIVNCKCETNIPGIFAAGDVTNTPAKQIIVACGEGAKAALSAFEYLSKKK